MSEQETSPNRNSDLLTQHAMLVLWGAYAQQIGLVKALEQVDLGQKTREHRPQTKIMEFLLAMLAGLPHLQDLSRWAHPLDQDRAVAEAWGLAGLGRMADTQVTRWYRSSNGLGEFFLF